jgi:hypothetical protein
VSLRLSSAAVRTYDALKSRPGATPRKSDARDARVLGAVTDRLNELISSYRITGTHGSGGATYVFWTEVQREVNAGAFDDLLDGL